jgi:hypothetical protein
MLRTYAALELVVGAVGLAIVGTLPALSGSLAALSTGLADMPVALNALRTSVALLALGLPAVAMGATLPVLLTALAPSERSFGRSLGVLYACNTAGAVLGVLGAELWLVPELGIFGSGCAAACVCGVIALVAALVAQLSASSAPGALRTANQDASANQANPARSASSAPLLLAAGLCGFALLGLETVWIRFLSLVLNDTPLAFAVVLATVLAGIAIGGAIGALLAARIERIERFAGAVALATGATGIGGYHGYTALIDRSFSFDQNAITVLLVCAPLVLPTCVLSGALYTLLGARLRASTTEVHEPSTQSAERRAQSAPEARSRLVA